MAWSYRQDQNADWLKETANNTITRHWKETSTNSVLDENARGLIVHAPVEVTFPSVTAFQQDKLYSVINASGGEVTLVAAPNETIRVGSEDMNTYIMNTLTKSVDFSRIGLVWWAQ